LLDGVTGSGKTEVYLKLVESVIGRGSQVLVLVPEIGLTPQLVSRFRRRLAAPIAVMHSGLSESQRHCAWHMAGRGEAAVVIGTRSAVFTPLKRPGLIVVDEEHDSSFKQQDGFRYNARDLAVFRARQYNIPVLLGSATPSLESLLNVQRRKYHYLSLPERAGVAELPRLDVIDIRHQQLQGGLSQRLLEQVYEHLEADAQVLLFLNRRGFAPVLLCHQCGWAVCCERCDAHMTMHAGSRVLRCHHCGAERPVPQFCPECGSPDLRGLGEGTERLEQELRHRFADISIVRIDRDTTRRRGEMQSKLDQIHRGEHRILIGTQMLSKGHDFPRVTLVGIVNADYGLYSTDFRAAERMAQLIVQVAGRAGRAGRPGKVILQTHLPDHPLLRMLLSGGYAEFAKAALNDRQVCGLPPCGHMAVLRAESPAPQDCKSFLERVRTSLRKRPEGEFSILGPAPPPMERRAGLYRMHLLVTARKRQTLSLLLDDWIDELDSMQGARKVRWSLDVDPVDLY
jgi:primosomal protein N' (replication factor Y)